MGDAYILDEVPTWLMCAGTREAGSVPAASVSGLSHYCLQAVVRPEAVEIGQQQTGVFDEAT